MIRKHMHINPSIEIKKIKYSFGNANRNIPVKDEKNPNKFFANKNLKIPYFHNFPNC